MDNSNVVAGSNPSAITLKIEPNVAANFQQLLDWRYRDLPGQHRPKLEAFMQSEIVTIADKSAQYVADAAYKKIEALIFKIASRTNKTPAEVAKDFKGFQLRG